MHSIVWFSARVVEILPAGHTRQSGVLTHANRSVNNSPVELLSAIEMRRDHPTSSAYDGGACCLATAN